MANLVASPDFKTPDSWRNISPRAEIAPQFSVNETGTAKKLVIQATGDKHQIGYWQGNTKLEVGKWYRASVCADFKDVSSPAMAIFAQVGKHLLLPKELSQGRIVLERIFRHERDHDGSNFELFLRAAENGRVEYYQPSLEEISEPPHRNARIATIRFGDAVDLSFEEQKNRISSFLEQAGALKPDLAMCTEFCPILQVKRSLYAQYADMAESVPDGPTCRIFAAAAKKHNMYVAGGLIERRGKHVYNSAVIFDRKGIYVGSYFKTHLTQDELVNGISCGDEYPVFDLDFGRIGIFICYDQWFPEVSRLLACKGAQILLLPVMGGKPITWRTRAIDNGVYVVSSAMNPPSMIIDSSGKILAETHGSGIVYADLNLDYRQTNAYIDPTLSYGMPTITPALRYCADDHMFDELTSANKKVKL